MRFERFIARRYLFAGQNRALVSLITIISIAGVALGVMALIVVIAVMDGFDQNLQKQIIGAQAHIEVRRLDSSSPPITTGSLDQIRQIPGVEGAGPVVMRYALVQVPGEGNEQRQTVLTIHGLDTEGGSEVTNVMDNVEGSSTPGPYEVVLGSVIAREFLDVKVGDQVRVIAPTFAQSGGRNIPLMRDVTVAGIFTTGFPENDAAYGYVSLEGAENLFMAPKGQVDALRIMVQDPSNVNIVATKVQELLGQQILVTTWQTRNKALFDALVLEKWAMFVILLFIVLVAAFNIVGTLTMVVTDKTREIGILKSMGATEGAILRIFRNQGLIIGAVGTGLGTIGGLATCYVLHNYISIPELQSAYMSDNIPVLLDPVMIVLIVGSAMMICLLASLYPARQAAKLDPVEALRYE